MSCHVYKKYGVMQNSKFFLVLKNKDSENIQVKYPDFVFPTDTVKCLGGKTHRDTTK